MCSIDIASRQNYSLMEHLQVNKNYGFQKGFLSAVEAGRPTSQTSRHRHRLFDVCEDDSDAQPRISGTATGSQHFRSKYQLLEMLSSTTSRSNTSVRFASPQGFRGVTNLREACRRREAYCCRPLEIHMGTCETYHEGQQLGLSLCGCRRDQMVHHEDVWPSRKEWHRRSKGVMDEHKRAH
jgi:hypothetical protein